MKSSAGFTLLEVLIATTLLLGAVASLAQLAAVATASNRVAYDSTVASLLAAQKLEELRALELTVAADGSVSTDTTSNTAALVEPSATGTGTSTSPSDSLERDVPGYVDYIDRFGRGLGDSGAPEGTRFVRRWSIHPQAVHSQHVLVLQVFVTSSPGRVHDGPDLWRRQRNEAWLVSLKTRKAP